MSERETPGASGLVFEEPLIFDQNGGGRTGISYPKLDIPDVDFDKVYSTLLRSTPAPLPALSEVDAVRHFTRLSSLNYHKDIGMYPLGSCTMKYNPKIANKLASEPAFAWSHPYEHLDAVQGNLEMLYELERMLAEIGGMDSVSLWPAAGSHGELTGLLMIRAYYESKGEGRKKVIIPDSAHGTNPASAAICNYEVVELKSNGEGIIDPRDVMRVMDEEVAAIMITNPNTLGIFEEHFAEIADVVHGKGGLVYCDGANLNALMGYVKLGKIGADVMHFNLHKTFGTPHGGGGPGSGPVGVKSVLEPFLPRPIILKKGDEFILDDKRSQSIGSIKPFWGNFSVLLRAYAYIMELGGDGLKTATELAVLNANYVRSQLRQFYHVPYERPVLHECVFSDKRQNESGVKTIDIAKRLMDYGLHPPTIYFPLIVSGALMIEPTETENKSQLDQFCRAMQYIADECAKNPDVVRSAPRRPIRRRLDEVKAVKELILKV